MTAIAGLWQRMVLLPAVQKLAKANLLWKTITGGSSGLRLRKSSKQQFGNHYL